MTPASPCVKYTAQSMPTEPDPSRCPLCGAMSGCAMAAGGDAATCWCMQVDIPAQVLGRIPEAARDRACICAACARGEAASSSVSRPLRTVVR